MSDSEQAEVKPFAIERAKQGRANCKKCKTQCESGSLRIARINPNNPFGSTPLKMWYHFDCFFEVKISKATKFITCSDEIDGWNSLSADDKKSIIEKIGPSFKITEAPSKLHNADDNQKNDSNDNLFSELQRIVNKIANESSYTNKSKILQKFLTEGTGKKFEGNLSLWLKLLMPKDAVKRVYNLQSKQIVKLFSRIFKINHDKMLDDLSEGDVSQTVAKFFEDSKTVKPASKSTLTLNEVDDFLEHLSKLTQEDPQEEHFKALIKRCTCEDLKTIIRLIKHDLKMNCGARHVLDALGPDAYSNFQKTRDLDVILNSYGNKIGKDHKSRVKKHSNLQLMTPISPMLAEPCKDFEKAIKKCPDGFYSEIKYDGERVQIHKKNDEFKFFSRNLKPVMDHKITKLKEFLPKAFPHGNDMILDSEILMVDTLTGDPLPFGSLGKHKKEEFASAETCLFIFDCLFFNGNDLTSKPLKERRKFLEDNLTVIKHRVVLSEYKLLKTKNDLIDMTREVLKKGLEGLVLKGVKSIYEPGKRRWLKVKKDYLMKGAIADSADLVVLGAWYGTGKMGGQFSIFLMGCYDDDASLWKTVTKVHSGLDDSEMGNIHKTISPLMKKCDGNTKFPDWIQLHRTMIPNAIATDPFQMPVFEITGAEFTDSDVHTAGSISIRFPRITKVRSDKSPQQATTLKELIHLYNESKEGVNLDELNKLKDSDDSEITKKRLKRQSTTSELKIPSKKIKMENCELFERFLLFCPDKINENFHKEIEEFIKLGGKCVDSSKDANLVLHETSEIKDSSFNLRKLYNSHCKHYTIAWLVESLKESSLKDPICYFVKWHQIFE
ncbi:CLUMA_CG017821, isoform A [Clunio marinus]|uniref:DNA ligase n=1 Tax=Clunio marinus TaxID=568069 RepID=A0A1J1J1M2_9DIPT|nr:CLUMA_CG017821, isoform A [Clunio marinus]